MSATQIQKQDIISSKSANYLVLDFIGEGSYGAVATCVNLTTRKTVAIKIHKSTEYGIIQAELYILKELRAIDPDKKNLARFIEHFMFKDLSCIAFEMLDRSLWDLVWQRRTPLSLNEIRPIAHQLLVAFEALKGIGIIHADLKPDNVMLVNHKDEPYRVKLIDFGLALPASQAQVGMTLQAIAYRAPEVILGLPISEAIDMWGLGCVLAQLYFKIDLFPGASTYQMIEVICRVIGQPAYNMLAAGKNTWQYFSWEQESPNQGWRLKTPEEYEEATGDKPKFSEWYLHTDGSLDAEIGASECHDNVEYRDRMAFLDLLKQLLSLSAEKRITPGQALKHSFLTMVHLEQDRESSSHAKAAFHLMDICAFRESDEMESNELARVGGPGLQKSPPIRMPNAWPDSNSIYRNVNTSSPSIEPITIPSNHCYPVHLTEHSSNINWGSQVDLEFPLQSSLKIESYWNYSSKTSDRDISSYKGDVSQVQCNDLQLPLHKSPFKAAFHLMDICAFRESDEMESNELACVGGPGLWKSPPIRMPNAWPDSNSIYRNVNTSSPSIEPITIPSNHCYPVHLTEHSSNINWGSQVDLEFPLQSSFKIEPYWNYSSKTSDRDISSYEGDVSQVQCNDLQLPLHKSPFKAAFHLMDICAFRESDEMESIERARVGGPGLQMSPPIRMPNAWPDSNSIYRNVNTSSPSIEPTTVPSNQCYPLHLTEHSSNINWGSQVDLEFPLQSSFKIEPYWNSSAKTSDSDSSNYKGDASQVQCNNLQLPLHRSPFVKEQYWDYGAKNSPSNEEDASSAFQVQKNDILSSKSARYLVLDFIGEGCFGKVAKCVNLKTFETTAIKIIKESTDELIQEEVDMLKEIRTLDPEKTNVVKFIDNFMFKGLSCIAFELLDRSLWDLVEEIDAPLSLNQIRPITQQLLVAFKALKGIGILHTDLKPDNVMLVNHEDEPFRVKLIDFGLAIPASKVVLGMNMQPIAYRAPEVNLGLPITEAIDMWGLGCVMAFLYFGNNLFPGTSANDMMNAVCQLLGQPADHLLNAGKKTYKYFTRIRNSTNPGWRLKTPVNPRWGFFGTVKNLDEAVKLYEEKHDVVMYEDTTAFLDLLKGLLDPNAETRITPEKALQHPFITMVHLEEKMKTSSHVKAAFELMTVCPLDDLDEIEDAETAIKSTSPAIGGATVGPGIDELDEIEMIWLPIRGSQELQMSPVQGPLGAHAVVYSAGERVAEIANLEGAHFTVLNAWPETTNFNYGVTDQPYDHSDHRSEMVDVSLSDLLWQRQGSLSLIEIRPITAQLLVALETLKGRGIIHTDMHPDNIMFLNPHKEPYRIKLNNSGEALPASEVEIGMALQQCAYRAPEVSLALPISEAIDMWGLGCVIAYMYFGMDLFPGETSYDLMKAVCFLLGQPEDHLLNAGENSYLYFNRAQGSTDPRWQLKTPEEHAETTGVQPKLSEQDFDSARTLDDAIGFYSNECDIAEFEDRTAFLHLLKQLLNPNPQTRITPRQALKHCFITGSHLKGYKNTSLYAVTAENEMQLSRLDDPDIFEDLLLDTDYLQN